LHYVHRAVKTRKDVGAEWRHDMRPSVQLPSVSSVDSKLGLTAVTPSLQSAPEPTALGGPWVNTTSDCCGFWRPVTLTFDLFNWKLALHLLVLWGTFELRQTDGRARSVTRPIGRPHNKVLLSDRVSSVLNSPFVVRRRRSPLSL